MFQSSPVPKDGCNLCHHIILAYIYMFQSSPVPKDGCNGKHILRRRRSAGFNPHPSRRTGATPPPRRPNSAGATVSFNPHPSRRTGATRRKGLAEVERRRFQSSPVPEDGCNRCLTVSSRATKCFNPHPSRRTGATSIVERYIPSSLGFNPHPSRRTGATAGGQGRCARVKVSILTRPGGRVQLDSDLTYQTTNSPFQSSPVPEDGCNQAVVQEACGANVFQSSPVPEDGCNCPQCTSTTALHRVSILTRPGGRVQRRSWS